MNILSDSKGLCAKIAANKDEQFYISIFSNFRHIDLSLYHNFAYHF